MSDGLNFLDRVAEPERNAAPAEPKGQVVRFVVNPQGLVDTSIAGPVMLQQPSRWTHDFDPDTGDSRAHLPAVVPIFANPPSGVTPPPGSSDQTLATTEFVSQAMREAVEEAVIKSRHGSDGRFPAAPGDIGEYLSVAVPSPGIELMAANFATVTQLELAPGEWIVTATAAFALQGGIGPYPNCYFVTSISETTSFGGFNQGVTSIVGSPFSPGTDLCLPVGLRILTGTPKTMFLLAYCNGFATPVRMFAYGYFNARRVR